MNTMNRYQCPAQRAQRGTVRTTSTVRKDFRQEFPQLCEPVQAPKPMDFSIIKDFEEPVKEVESSLPYGWINLRDYNHDLVSSHEWMRRAVEKMRVNWERWDWEHEIYVNYSEHDDGLVEYDTESESSDSTSAEDPDEVDDRWT